MIKKCIGGSVPSVTMRPREITEQKEESIGESRDVCAMEGERLSAGSH